MYNTLNGRTGELVHVSVNRVAEITRDAIRMESRTLGGDLVAQVMRTRGFNLTSVEAADFTQRARPHYPNYAFPLQVGKTWRQEVDLRSTRALGNQVLATLEGRVAGWETVTVPAGNFRALKIVLRGWYQASSLDGAWNGRIEDTLWYAPEVRNAVRYEYRDTSGVAPFSHDIHELVRYWLAP
jgi:hypothetical protein